MSTKVAVGKRIYFPINKHWKIFERVIVINSFEEDIAPGRTILGCYEKLLKQKIAESKLPYYIAQILIKPCNDLGQRARR